MGILGLVQHSTIRFSIAALLSGCAVVLMFLAIQDQRIFTAKRIDSIDVVVKDARLLTRLAEQKYLIDADLDTASDLVEEALTLTPYHVPALLLLAQILYDSGDAEKANETLDYIDKLTTDIKRYRWEKALVSYQFGRTEMLAEDISYIAREIGGPVGNKALRLAFSTWQEPEELLNKLGPDALMVLFNYAVRYPHLDKALFFWEQVEARGLDWRKDDLLTFVDMLFNMGRLKESAAIWKKHFNPETIVYDGTFSEDFRQHAFTWRSNSDRSFTYSFEPPVTESDKRILHYRFTGWDNPEISYISQVIPLAGGDRYSLTFEIKSDQLTTDKRPFIDVAGFNCNDGNVVETNMVAPAQDWTTYRLDFEVPEQCSAVMLRFRRQESLQIDNRLAGDIWLRSMAIAEQEKPYTVAKGPMQ
ncbi:tetratricopeptide repeat protein [Desulfosediminicola flagellatus]|uniref:tetratricopeptide repeat protein n=1 Tax=Desulfosediminicola flagellatus TaxID=2569541 RepID=UPI0010AC6AE7|nr:tetratricopeptide repeat protein [Desulfosediminicola flagellatus]